MDNCITKISFDNKKVLVEIDGEHHLFLYNRDLNRAKFAGVVKEGNCLTKDELKALEEHVINRGKKRIMFLLGKQDYPLNKLRDKLIKEHYIDSHVDEILKPFVNKGFVDDKKLAKRRVESYKGYKSKREISYKLRNNGFSSEDIKEVMEENFKEDDEFESAYLLLVKKFSLKKLKLEEAELKKKALGYLSRKGYPIGVCFKAFDKFSQEK